MLEKIVVNNGVKIQYKIRRGRGKALIFLHGGGGSLSAWEIILPLFKDTDSTLITVDLRGHGLSDRPKGVDDYLLEKHAEDISKILAQEKLDKIVLVGHCLGSMVAATFAAQYPQRVGKLVLINTGSGLPWNIGRTPFRPIFYRALNILKHLFPYKSAPRQRVDYFEFTGSSDIDWRRFKADMNVMGLYSAIRQTLAMFYWGGEEYLGKVTVPALVIAGTKDLLYPKNTSEKAAGLIKNSRLEYIDSNHISVINSPKDIYGKIMEFLRIT